MRRILIIGPPGAGKTTLAKELGAIIGVHVIHLDKVFWKPGWVKTPLEDRIAFLKELEKESEWILDGNYLDTMDVQLRISNAVILLDFPRYICFWRVFKRRFLGLDSSPPEVAPGIPDKIDFDFLKSIWLYPSTEGEIVRRKIEPKQDLLKIRLHNPLEVNRFLQRVRKLDCLPISSRIDANISDCRIDSFFL